MKAMAVPEIVRDPSESEPLAPAAPREAISQPIRTHEPAPSAWSPDEAAQKEEAQNQKPNRFLVIALVTALTLTGLTLASQMRTTAALERQVSALEIEVAQAQAAVAGYQTRFERIRGEVGELVTRIGTLSSLVTPAVLAEGVSEDSGDSLDVDFDDAIDDALDPTSAAPSERE